MNIIYVLIGLIGVCIAAPAPQNWPYRDSLHPYYYGYPGQTPYVYKSSLEDDEEPVERSRQDGLGQSVPSLIHAAAVKQQEQLSNFGSERPTVVETGSAAPVQDRPGDSSSPSKSKVTGGPSPPNVVKPGVVNPPAFPPLRPAQPPKKQQPAPTPTDEDEDEDDDDDETQEEEDEEAEAEDEEEEEEEEERAREDKEEKKPVPVVPVAIPDNVTSLESVEVVQSPVGNVSQPVKPVVGEGNEESVNEVERPEDDNSDENSSDSVEGVEALVPGYVTDLGEVLVPVDTVTGDQPISIVPDPYTPVARGVPLNYYGYNSNPLQHQGYQTYQSPVPVPGRYFRQEEFGNEDEEGDAQNEDNEDEDEEEEEDDAEAEPVKKKTKVPLGLIPATAPTNEDDEVEAGRFRTGAFPPSRSPVLVPVTFKYNGGYLTGPFDQPVDSTEVFQYVQPTIRQPARPYVRRPPVSPNSAFYAFIQQRQTPAAPFYGSQGTPVGEGYYQVRIKQQVPVSRRPVPFYAQNVGQSVARPYPYRPQPYAQRRQPYPTRTGPYNQRPRPHVRRPVYGPRPYSNEQEQAVFYPQRPATLHNPGERLKIKSSYELLVEPPKPQYLRVRTKARPSNKKHAVNKKNQVIKRRPVNVVQSTKQSTGQLTPVLYRPLYNVEPLQRVTVNGQGYRQPPNAYQGYREFIKGLAAGYYGQRPGQNRPTPVIKQDEPMADSNESVELQPQQQRQQRRNPKSRREAKKVKKVKKVTDPLNILKKITKKS